MMMAMMMIILLFIMILTIYLHTIPFSSELIYGLLNRLKFFQNSAGGHVTLTSSSRRVIESLLSNSHPVVRLVLTAVKGHLDNYFDGGLQTALLVFRYNIGCGSTGA